MPDPDPTAHEGATRLTSPQALPVFLTPEVVAAVGAPGVDEDVSWFLEFTAAGEAGGGSDQGTVRLHARVDPLPTGEGAALSDVDHDLGFGVRRHPVLLTAGAATLLWRPPQEVTGEVHLVGRVTALAGAPTRSTPPTPCRVLDLQVEERRFVDGEGERPDDFDVDTPDGYVEVTGIPPVYTPVATAPARFGTLRVHGEARTLETGVLAVVDVVGHRPPRPGDPISA